jgi:hypothetical protein
VLLDVGGRGAELGVAGSDENGVPEFDEAAAVSRPSPLLAPVMKVIVMYSSLAGPGVRARDVSTVGTRIPPSDGADRHR